MFIILVSTLLKIFPIAFNEGKLLGISLVCFPFNYRELYVNDM